jgi:hypothetical protein
MSEPESDEQSDPRTPLPMTWLDDDTTQIHDTPPSTSSITTTATPTSNRSHDMSNPTPSPAVPADPPPTKCIVLRYPRLSAGLGLLILALGGLAYAALRLR